LSWCAGHRSRHEAAVRLAAAAAAIRHRIGAPAKALEREKLERALARAAANLSTATYDAAWQEGLTAQLDRVLGLQPSPRPDSSGTRHE
jgi:hypothetical protein